MNNPAYVVYDKADFLSYFILYTISPVLPNKCAPCPLRRQMSKAACGIAALHGAPDHAYVCICCKDSKFKTREPWSNDQIPQNCQSVWFLSGSAAYAPAAKHAIAPFNCILRQLHENILFKKSEYFPIAIKARYRYPAKGVKHRPFNVVFFEEGPICPDIGNAQVVHSSNDSLADLAADLPKPLPSHPEPHKRPSEELNAIIVLHDTFHSLNMG